MLSLESGIQAHLNFIFFVIRALISLCLFNCFCHIKHTPDQIRTMFMKQMKSPWSLEIPLLTTFRQPVAQLNPSGPFGISPKLLNHC